MKDETRLHFEAKAKQLRADLKRWENDWSAAHGGNKPGRQDIKDNADIAQKYKEYNKVRDVLAGKVPPLPSKDDEPEPRKRKPDPPPSETPSKRTKHAETPSQNRTRDADFMNTPAISRKLFSPAPVTSLGPTPQRDGRVLGLFDLLVEKELRTPPKRDRGSRENSQGQCSVQATPRRRTSTVDPDSASRLGRTPMSASKRQLLNAFTTPRKDRTEKPGGKTPTSASKLQLDTPAFLKRHALPKLDENAAFDAPTPLRLPRKPLARGLSEIVASLRKVEEEKLDEDLEALREAENEQAGLGRTRASPQAPSDILVQDSQPGAFGEAAYESPVEDALDGNGRQLPVHKKKAPKRTTRRVNIKPTWMKRPAAVAQSEEENVVPDTQADTARTSVRAAEAEDSDAGFDGGARESRTSAAKAGAKEGTIRKTVRKVSELAHANFHRLKLRNSGPKGGPGHNSRFRRRR